MGELVTVTKPVEQGLAPKPVGLGKQLLKRMLPWFITDLILIGVFIASFIIISYTPFPSSASELLIEKYSQLRNLTKGLSSIPLPVSIFINNAIVTLVAFIPIIGIAFFASTMYWTARVLQLVSILFSCVTSVSREAITLTLATFLLLTPHTYLEFFAYGIAIYQNLRLSYLIVKRRWSEFKREARLYLLSISVAMAFLLLGAFVEATLINTFSTPYPASTLPPPQKVEQVLKSCLHNA